MDWRVVCGALLLAAIAPGAGAQTPARPVAGTDADLDSIIVPDLNFTPSRTDLEKYPRNFFAHRRGVSFAVAYADLGDCDRVSALSQSAFARPTWFVPYGPVGIAQPDFRRPNMGGILPALGDNLISRNIHFANRRECLLGRGYTLYGVTSAAWEAIEANGPDAALRIRAKLASGPDPVQPVAFAPASYPQLPPLAAMPPQTVIARKPGTVTLNPSLAYVLVRSKVPKGSVPYNLVLVRELTRGERDGYEAARRDALARAQRPDRFTFVYDGLANVVRTEYNQRFADSGDERYFMFAVQPGSYLVAGTGNSCLCMGSVKFEARAGQITDMGYFFSGRTNRPSPIPELAPLVGQPNLRSHAVWIMASALRPYRSDMAVPEELKALPRVAADYHAVGMLPNLFGVFVARLAPIPGVLAYDGGRVIDVRSGRDVAPVE